MNFYQFTKAAFHGKIVNICLTSKVNFHIKKYFMNYVNMCVMWIYCWISRKYGNDENTYLRSWRPTDCMRSWVEAFEAVGTGWVQIASGPDDETFFLWCCHFFENNNSLYEIASIIHNFKYYSLILHYSKCHKHWINLMVNLIIQIYFFIFRFKLVIIIIFMVIFIVTHRIMFITS